MYTLCSVQGRIDRSSRSFWRVIFVLLLSLLTGGRAEKINRSKKSVGNFFDSIDSVGCVCVTSHTSATVAAALMSFHRHVVNASPPSANAHGRPLGAAVRTGKKYKKLLFLSFSFLVVFEVADAEQSESVPLCAQLSSSSTWGNDDVVK
jgi:hypothetical protein